MPDQPEKIEFNGSEIDPVDTPEPIDRRQELRDILSGAVRSLRTAAMFQGDARRASCPLDMRNGRTVRLVVSGGGNARSMLHRYLLDARLIP